MEAGERKQGRVGRGMDLGGAREGVSILKLEILKKVFDLRSKGRGKEYKHFLCCRRGTTASLKCSCLPRQHSCKEPLSHELVTPYPHSMGDSLVMLLQVAPEHSSVSPPSEAAGASLWSVTV